MLRSFIPNWLTDIADTGDAYTFKKGGQKGIKKKLILSSIFREKKILIVPLYREDSLVEK